MPERLSLFFSGLLLRSLQSVGFTMAIVTCYAIVGAELGPWIHICLVRSWHSSKWRSSHVTSVLDVESVIFRGFGEEVISEDHAEQLYPIVHLTMITDSSHVSNKLPLPIGCCYLHYFLASIVWYHTPRHFLVHGQAASVYRFLLSERQRSRRRFLFP